MSLSRSDYKILYILLAIVVLAALITGWLFLKSNDAQTVPSQAEMALQGNQTSAPYTTLDGEPIDLNQFAGKILVVNAWASWSPASAKELVNLAKLQTNYRDNGVVVLAINRQELAPKAKSYVQSLGNLDGLTVILDPSDHFYDSVGGFAMPETLFYATDGSLVTHKRGPMNYEQMQQLLESLLPASTDNS